MKRMICSQCGASDWKDDGKYQICNYCGTKYLKESNNERTIDLTGDINSLLEKCKKYPSKARRYANLILDIDPDNQEARKYLK